MFSQGIPPATVVEWTLDAGGQDFYDGLYLIIRNLFDKRSSFNPKSVVSLVDGFNLPVA